MMRISLIILSLLCCVGTFGTVNAADNSTSTNTNNDNNKIEEHPAGDIGTHKSEQQSQTPGQTPAHEQNGPDQSCLFKPEQAKCSSHGMDCPTGFNNNEDGNCFPQHDKCPRGFHGHEDDETGRCIPDSTPCEPGYIRDPSFPSCSKKESVCRDHPDLAVCGNQVIIVKNIIHKHSHSTSGSSHNLNKDCFDAIKIAWFGKIHRGQNQEVDKFIDKCLLIVTHG